ncbi:hypothetical protein [Ferroacidibacillus organovorans]|uniref:hypothetical protein n=1 Tax=Ferroacidibacillus organovorans TaxID=1765683 RepID=UPI00082F4206|nr:hypothetical protein [Ferroacidibacillus organovorans]
MQKSTWERIRERLLETPKEGMRYKQIITVGAIFGVLGAVIGYISKGPVAGNLSTSLALSMLMSPYFIIPRVKSRRVIQGTLGGVFSGIVTMVLLFVFASARYWPARSQVISGYVGYLFGTIAVAWLFTFVSQWTDKKRLELEAKRGAQPARSKAKVPEKPRVRVHRYNRKKKR